MKIRVISKIEKARASLKRGQFDKDKSVQTAAERPEGDAFAAECPEGDAFGRESFALVRFRGTRGCGLPRLPYSNIIASM